MDPTQTQIDEVNKMPEQNWADPDGDGILADMAREFDESGELRQKSNQEPLRQEKKSEQIEKKPSKEKQDLEKKDDVSAFDDLEEEDFFPSVDDEKKEDSKKESDDKDVFNEEAYDSQTEAILKKLEEKGHPGDIYKELRAEVKAFRQREAKGEVPEEVKAKLAKVDSLTEENDGLKARLEELSNVSAKVKMENSPEFEAQVLKPAVAILKAADEISSQYEGGNDILRNIIRTVDRKQQNEMIREHLSELSEFDRSEVYRLASEYRSILAKREELLQSAQSKIDQIESQRLEETNRKLEEQRTIFRNLQKDVWDRYKDRIDGLLDEDGNESEEFLALRKKALSIDFSKARAKDQAFAAFAGTALPFVLKKLSEYRAKVAEYEGRDARVARRSPSPGSSVMRGGASDSEGDGDDFMAGLLKVKA